MSKHLHPGKAALNGILAADLARLGFTGATRILEGERGFFRATAASFDAGRVTDRLGDRWLILENCYKLHSCCAHTHTAIDVALDIRARRRWSAQKALDSIVRIDLATYGPGYEIVSDPNPTTPYRAKFSLAYCVAAALVEGQVGLDQFSADRFSEAGVVDARIASLLPRIHVSVRDDLSARYPARWPTNVVVTLRDSGVERGMNDYPRGNPENPVSTDTLEQKFTGLVTPRHGEAVARRALDAARALGDCADVRLVFAELFA
jgi:2-methylcitrate dehydratase PrpD